MENLNQAVLLIIATFFPVVIAFIFKIFMGRLINAHDKQTEKFANFIDISSKKMEDLSLQLALLKKDIELITSSTQLLREMHQEHYRLKSSVEAMWKKMDEFKLDLQDADDWIIKLRERSHTLANWCQVTRNKTEGLGAKFNGGEWDFNKKE